mgnify:CR=1 FL=1
MGQFLFYVYSILIMAIMKRLIYPKRLGLLFILSTLLIVTGCVSAKKRFERGDYDAATLQAIKRLRNNPDSKKARQYLPLAYQHALDFHLNRIKQLKASSDLYKWDGVVTHYSQLNMLHDEITRCPGCLSIVKNPKVFQSELNSAKLAASKVYFESGLTELKKETKESARAAYKLFLTAKDYTPEYTGIDTYIEDALAKGTVHVLIEDIPVHSRSLSLTNEFFQNSILEHVRNLNLTFVQFYREADVLTADFVPDEVVIMQFDDFVVGQTLIKERVELIERDSVKVGTVKTSDGEKPVFGTVKAELTTFEKTLVSSGLLDFQIINATTGSTIQQRKLPGTFVWKTDWASFNGQEEALSDNQLALTRQREAFPPSPQDLFVEFTQPIYNQVISSLNRYYRQFN